MMKKTTQRLLLIFSTLLLLVSVTVSAQGQPAQDRRRGNAPNFGGVWNAVTGKGKKIVITLRHDRSDFSAVSGIYLPSDALTASYMPSDNSINGFVKVSLSTAPVPQSPGSIKGKLTDNVLRFTWVQDSGRGSGRLTLSSDGESFEGTFNATSDPDDTSGDTLNGTRAPNFAGAWSAKLGDTGLELIFQQTGNQVTGQVRGFSYDVIIRDGKVVDNTLSFTVLRADPTVLPGRAPRYLSIGGGELVMDRGSKSFTGTFLGAATSGTLIAR